MFFIKIHFILNIFEVICDNNPSSKIQNISEQTCQIRGLCYRGRGQSKGGTNIILKAVAHWMLKGLTILPQKSTKSVPTFLFFEGGEHGKCQMCTLNREKCTDLALFWSHTQMCTAAKKRVMGVLCISTDRSHIIL